MQMKEAFRAAERKKRGTPKPYKSEDARALEELQEIEEILTPEEYAGYLKGKIKELEMALYTASGEARRRAKADRERLEYVLAAKLFYESDESYKGEVF